MAFFVVARFYTFSCTILLQDRLNVIVSSGASSKVLAEVCGIQLGLTFSVLGFWAAGCSQVLFYFVLILPCIWPFCNSKLNVPLSTLIDNGAFGGAQSATYNKWYVI